MYPSLGQVGVYAHSVNQSPGHSVNMSPVFQDSMSPSKFFARLRRSYDEAWQDEHVFSGWLGAYPVYYASAGRVRLVPPGARRGHEVIHQGVVRIPI